MGETAIKNLKAIYLFGFFFLAACGLTACGSEQKDLAVVVSADKMVGTVPLEVTFSTMLSGGDSGEVQYSWDFGTGDTAQGGPSQPYTFKQAGSFLVRVKVSKNAQTAEASVRVDVSAPPVVPNRAPTITLTASPTTGKAPLEVTFRAAAADPDGDPLSYRWAFGDGETAAETAAQAKAQTHTFTKPGTYAATVTVNDGRGGSAEAKTRVVVTEPETAPKPDPDPQVPPTDPPGAPDNKAPTVSLSAEPSGGTAPLSVSFKADARDPEGDPLTYTWDFGNGKTVEGNSSRTVTYTEPGRYTAALTVSDGLAKVSAEAKITVKAPAPPDTPPENNPPENVRVTADPPTGATPLQVEFRASATDPDDDPLVYLWDFGDGVISGENPALHTYQRAGTYTASVTVGDRQGGQTRQEVAVVVTGAKNAPDVPFYGEWAWTARSQNESFTGYLSVSQRSVKEDSGAAEFFVRGGKGAWTYCNGNKNACGAPAGTGYLSVLDFGDGETFEIIFFDRQTGAERLVAFDNDDRIGTRAGAPLFEGEATWFKDDGSGDDLKFTLIKVADEPQTALGAALEALTTP